METTMIKKSDTLKKYNNSTNLVNVTTLKEESRHPSMAELLDASNKINKKYSDLFKALANG